jgi:hypothetical protein
MADPSKQSASKVIHKKKETRDLAESFKIPELNDEFALVVEDYLNQINEYQNTNRTIIKEHHLKKSPQGPEVTDPNSQARLKEIQNISEEVFNALGDKNDVESFLGLTSGAICDFYGKNFNFSKTKFFS